MKKQYRDHRRKHIVQNSKKNVDVPWDNRFLEPSENRVKSHCKQKATRRTALSYSACHQELSSFCSRKFHMCNTVPVNAS